MNQLQLKQRTESLQNAESSLSEMSNKLRLLEENAEKEADRVSLAYSYRCGSYSEFSLEIKL
jgi:hypothetical protein